MRHDDHQPTAPDSRFTARGADDGGLVERLLAAAGPGPGVPEDGADRVRDAIRPAWQELAAERSRRRRLLWSGTAAAAAAVLIVAAVWLAPGSGRHAAPEPRATFLAAVQGALEVTPPGAGVIVLTAAHIGADVPPGSLLRTRSADRAALGLPDGGSLRLDRGTLARLDSSASVSLEDGAVYVSSAVGSAAAVEVRTALGTAREIGTQFEVRRRGDRLDVTVRDGSVSLRRSGEDYRITHGVRLRVDADGGVTTGSVSTYDEAWDWVQEVAPVFAIEGRTVLAFLDWYSSETGLSVRFADPGVERLAAETVLHGSIDQIHLATAPEVLLPSCRLDLTREPGSILIRRLEQRPAGSATGPPG